TDRRTGCRMTVNHDVTQEPTTNKCSVTISPKIIYVDATAQCFNYSSTDSNKSIRYNRGGLDFHLGAILNQVSHLKRRHGNIVIADQFAEHLANITHGRDILLLVDEKPG